MTRPKGYLCNYIVRFCLQMIHLYYNTGSTLLREEHYANQNCQR